MFILIIPTFFKYDNYFLLTVSEACNSAYADEAYLLENCKTKGRSIFSCSKRNKFILKLIFNYFLIDKRLSRFCSEKIDDKLCKSLDLEFEDTDSQERFGGIYKYVGFFMIDGTLEILRRTYQAPLYERKGVRMYHNGDRFKAEVNAKKFLRLYCIF